NGDEELELFDSKLLQEIDFAKSPVSFPNGISITNPGESLVMRSLKISDFDKGYFQLLSQLTDTSNTTKEIFLERFHAMKNCKDTYYATVVEDTSTNQIIAGATLEIEQKFIRQCAIRGRIEEVVVLEEYRGKQLGKL
ncbi:putative glucosamine 6-phosphate N-acetyltransferase-like, partial [Apostichopus japonicus]